MKSFVNKNVVITGAGSGIGKELTKLFAEEKANIAIIDVNETALKTMAAEMSNYHVQVNYYNCDLSSKKAIDETVEKIQRDFGQINILVNNAGVISGKFITDLSYEEIRLTLDVNLMAVMWMTKKFVQEMIERNEGHIVNVASAAGLIGAPKMGDYCASKFGVIGFSETLRMELNKLKCKGVKITVVCPSLVNTGMFEGFQPPLLNPALETQYAARKIIQAVKKDKYYLKMPFMVKTILLFKLLPVSFVDRISDWLGVTRTMDNFSKSKANHVK